MRVVSTLFRIFAAAVVLAGMAVSLFGQDAIRVAEGAAIKNAVKKVEPEFPAMARQLRISGRVQMEVHVDADGNVESVKAVSGNPLLTNSASTALKKWKFNPFTADGKAVKAVASISFDFVK